MKRLLSVCLTFCMLFGTVFGLSLLTEASGSTVWDGTTDTSWYNTTDTAFTLTDGADLAGFAAIVNGTAEGIEQTNFEGKTVRLGADIVLNDGDAKTWGPSTAGPQAFPMIGNLRKSANGKAETDVSKYFAGEFDGQGYTISGLFINQKVDSLGEGSALFAAVYGSASLHDFSLVNSYISNPGNYAAAAITAYVMPKSSAEADAFHIYNIYTDAIVTASNNKNFGIGGIVGRIGYAWNSAKVNDYNTISSCVFAGTIIHTGTGLANAGGIIGDVYDHGVNVSDCLNLGIVQSVNNGNYIGGIVGRGNPNNCKVTVVNCVNTVSPDTTNATAAEILSMEDKTPRSDFAVKDCFYVGNKPAVTRNDKAFTNTNYVSATKVTAEQLTGLGVSGEITSKLTGWILRDGQVMIPAGAAAVVPSEPSHFAPVTEGGVAFRGVQNTEVQDGSFNLRFIGTVDSLQYSALGYDLSCTWADGSKPVTEFTTDTVYKTITATENGMTKQYTAEGFSAEYIWAVTVVGIPAIGDMTFTVEPFSCDLEGNKTTIGVYTLVYRDGQFVSLTRQK